MESKPQTGQAFSRIVGSQLSAVAFVQNYLQLQFDGPTLTLLTPVTVRLSSGGIVPDHATGWRDALCAQIARTVQNVRVDDNEFAIEFADGSAISASVRPEDYRCPEAVQFRDGETIVVI